MNLLLLVLLAFASCSPEAGVPEQGPQTFKDKMVSRSSSFFGDVELNTVNPRVTFEEDMYVATDLFCSSNNYVPSTPTCLPCNYTGTTAENTDNVIGLTEEHKALLPPCECHPSFVEAELIAIGDAPRIVTLTKGQGSKVFKFENNDWTTGIVVTMIPLAGTSDYFLSASPTFDVTKTFSYSYFTDPIINMMACPSFNHYGGASESSTNFLVLLASSDVVSYELTIRRLPFLDDPPVITPTLSTPEGSFSVPLAIGDAPVYMKDSFNQLPNGDYPGYYRYGLVYGPITECGEYSFHLEIVNFDFEGLNYFGRVRLSAGRIRESQLEYLKVRTLEARPFKDVELVREDYNQSLYYVFGSGGYVASVCPFPGEKTYIIFNLNTGKATSRDYEFLLYVRNATTSPFLDKKKIGELAPVHLQRVLSESITLQCPCVDGPNEDCDDPLFDSREDFRHFNRISVIREESYVNFTGGLNAGHDLASAIAVPFPPVTDQFEFSEEDAMFVFRCYHDYRDSSCGVIRPIPVLEEQNPIIYPPPAILWLERGALCESHLDEVSRPAVLNNSIGLLIFQKIRDTTFFTNERLDTCRIAFPLPSRLLTESGGPPVQQAVYLNELSEREECSGTDFLQVANNVEDLEGHLSALVNTNLVKRNKTAEEFVINDYSRTCGLQYGSYELLFTDEWQNCEDLTNSFVNFETAESDFTNTDECPVYDAEDPCCNSALSWSQCCIAEGRTVTKTVDIPAGTNSEDLQSCRNPDCMETFVLDYSDAYRRVNLEDFCQSQSDLQSDPATYIRTCNDQWIGDDLSGKYCDSHQDCIDLFGTGSCDLTQRRCVGVRKPMEIGFLQCLLDNMNSITQSAFYVEIVDSLGISNGTTSGVLSAEFLHEYLSEEQCTSDYGPMSPFRTHYESSAILPKDQQLCPSCFDVWCLMDLGCDLPLQCLDDRELCSPALRRTPSTCTPVEDEEHLVCNWNNGNADCEAGVSKCMFCHNSTNCVAFNATQEECNNTPICLLQTGEVLWNVSEADCQARESCSQLCQGQNCTSQEQCESVSGKCSDADLITQSIEYAAGREPLLAGARSGVCVRPLNAFNAPACPYVSDLPVHVTFGGNSGVLDSSLGASYDFTTNRGCVLFANCTSVSSTRLEYFGSGTGGGILPVGCVPYADTQQECTEVWNGNWLSLPINTQEACENPLQLAPEDAPGFCREPNSPYLSRKTYDECSSCDGEPVPPAEWIHGSWIRGFSGSPEWRVAELLPPFHIEKDTISFPRLDELFAKSVTAVDAFAEQAEIHCKISPFSNYIELLSCDCGGDTNGTCASPFSDQSNIFAFVWFCPGVDFKTGLLSGELDVSGADVLGETCKISSVSFAPVDVFVANHEREPLTVLGDPNEIDQFAVRNAEGASVGIVVGDGFALNDVNNVTWRGEVQKMTVEFLARARLISTTNPNYYFDIGYEILDRSKKLHKDEIEIRPLNSPNLSPTLPIGETDGDVLVTGTLVAPLSFTPGTRVYPIAVAGDWEKQAKDNILSDGEQVMVAVFAGLYGLGFILVAVVLVKFLASMSSLTNLLMIMFVMLTLLFRCIYLSMFAAGELQTEDISSFVLVEPPSFFLISVGGILMMSYAFCAYCVKTQEPQQSVFVRYWTFFLVSQLILYLILAIVLIVLSEIDTADSVTESCFGREVEVEENFSVQAVRIAYHSFLLVVAIISVVSILYYNRQIEHQTKQIQSLKLLTYISSISIFLTNLLWVIYSAVSGSSPYFVIPLYLCEGLMLTVLPFLVGE